MRRTTIHELLARDGHRDRGARAAGVAVPGVLAGLGALHAVWAAGSPWPAASRDALAEAVLSTGERMPPDSATWAVAGLLVAGAAVVRGAARSSAPPRLRALTLAVGGLFAARAVVYLPADLAGGFATTYQRMDAAVYAPLCLGVAAGALAVARRHGPAPSVRAATA